jgi:UDP-3-O-acyl-N-acetylglucosamine deacetylase
MSVKFHLDYGADNAIGRQTLTLAVTPESFRRELSPARTFMLKSEADWLLAQGLGKRATLQDLLVFDSQGPIDNELRYRDECVRHKTLDLIGDLSLAQCDFVGHFIAYRSGHRLNADLVRALVVEAEWVGAHHAPQRRKAG